MKKEIEWEKRLNDLERKTERGMYWVRLDMVRDIICEAVLSREKEIADEVEKYALYCQKESAEQLGRWPTIWTQDK